jgi:hypothetical protein
MSAVCTRLSRGTNRFTCCQRYGATTKQAHVQLLMLVSKRGKGVEVFRCWFDGISAAQLGLKGQRHAVCSQLRISSATSRASQERKIYGWSTDAHLIGH